MNGSAAAEAEQDNIQSPIPVQYARLLPRKGSKYTCVIRSADVTTERNGWTVRNILFRKSRDGGEPDILDLI